MSTEVKYTMNRVVKGSRTMFFPTINGKRLNSTNYARKAHAKALVQDAIKQYGADELLQLAGVK